MTEKDYEVMSSWFEKQTGVGLNKGLLSVESYMYFDSRFPVAAICLFVNAPVAFLAFPTANPDTMPEERAEALNKLIAHCEEIAKKAGCIFTLTYSSRKSVEERFLRNGYVVGDTQCVNLLKKIGE